MKLKVCGMKHNTEEVAALLPDYLGFIFYEKSPRHYQGSIPEIDPNIKKVGVFVDVSISFIVEKTEKHHLDIIQLHGNESRAFIIDLRAQLAVQNRQDIILWKVFSIKDHFNFNDLEAYEDIVHAYLFDTKGVNKGGNGHTFDWSVLDAYPSKKPFVLSGGIGLEEIEELQKIQRTALPILAIDLNSKFEKQAGLKDIEALTLFKTTLTNYN